LAIESLENISEDIAVKTKKMRLDSVRGKGDSLGVYNRFMTRFEEVLPNIISQFATVANLLL
jgi:hypothetical protein